MLDAETETLDGGKDIVGGFGPFEGLWIVVVAFDKGEDVGFELAGRDVDAALQLLARQLDESAFDLSALDGVLGHGRGKASCESTQQ